MSVEWIIIILLAAIGAVIAAALISTRGTVRDLEDICIEQETKLDDLSKHNAELSADKLRLTKLAAELADENDSQLEIIKGYKNEVNELQGMVRRCLAIFEQAEAAQKERQEPEVEIEPTAPSGINWSFDRLPEGLTNTYRCEDWHLFASGTEQELLQRECLTDIETGIRFLERSGKQYLCAAMGSAYGITIGSGFEVELENGEIINVVLADFKHPITDARADDFGDADINYNGQATTCVLEFVYDEKVAPDIVIQRGGMFIDRFGGLSGENGNLVRITYEGRVWEP